MNAATGHLLLIRERREREPVGPFDSCAGIWEEGNGITYQLSRNGENGNQALAGLHSTGPELETLVVTSHETSLS